MDNPFGLLGHLPLATSVPHRLLDTFHSTQCFVTRQAMKSQRASKTFKLSRMQYITCVRLVKTPSDGTSLRSKQEIVRVGH